MLAPEGSPLARRCASLGNLCLALGILEIVYCGQRVIFQLMNSRILAAERTLLPSTPHGPSKAIYAAGDVLARQVTPWELGRTVPFLVASVVLLFIARRLRAGDLGVLGAVRQWAIAALGVVAVSLLVQIVAIAPPTMDYQARVVELMPKASTTKAPFDVGQFMSSMTVVGLVMGLAMGTVAMSVWPVIAYVWAGRIRRDASTTAESSALGPEVGSSHEDHR